MNLVLQLRSQAAREEKEKDAKELHLTSLSPKSNAKYSSVPLLRTTKKLLTLAV